MSGSATSPLIRETALGGADTTTRNKVVWQVKLTRDPVDGAATCSQFGSGWQPPETLTTGSLSAFTTAVTTASGPCVLPSTAGFQRTENQLYRVEIHQSGSRDDPNRRASFKWSRDNGAVATQILSVVGQTVVVQDLGRDEVLGFANGQWVEILDESMELTHQRGFLVQIDSINRAKREITFEPNPALPALDLSRPAKLRRWDQTENATETGIPLSNTPMPIEDGISVEFGAGDYQAGEYWLIPARTAINSETGSIEWERDDANQPRFLRPHGIQHHYCPLALVEFDSTNNLFALVTNPDCRRPFPPLTAITARDVSYDNTLTQPDLLGATTVQAAIDLLYRRQTDGCTLIVLPTPGWEATLATLTQQQDAQICFQAGTYLVNNPVVLRNLGRITLSGCGGATRILALTSETVFRFVNCQEVVVRDLHVQSGHVGSLAPTGQTHLNGTLTFAECPTVTVERASVKCAAGPVRAAACITVRDRETYNRGLPVEPQPTTLAQVRLRHNNLQVGHQQVGILLVNVARATVEDNVLKTATRPQHMTLHWLLENRSYRAMVRSIMMRQARFRPADDEVLLGLGEEDVVLEVGGRFVWFKADPELVPVWEQLIAAHPPLGVQRDADLLAHLETLADRALLNGGLVRLRDRQFSGFRPWYRSLTESNPSVASQGIVIAGRIANEVRILNNTIRGVMQGIHLGLSHRGQSINSPNILGTVHILDNHINVLVAPGRQDRHGIFVGNCDSLIVQNNYCQMQRFPVTQRIPVEGTRVVGRAGAMMILRQNHFANCTIGLNVILAGSVSGRPQWIVTDNVAPQSRNPILVPNFSNLVRGIPDNYA
jgi:Family of unknown function (DUF6519)